MLQNELGPIFPLGQLTMTPGARKSLRGRDLLDALLRYMRAESAPSPTTATSSILPCLPRKAVASSELTGPATDESFCFVHPGRPLAHHGDACGGIFPSRT